MTMEQYWLGPNKFSDQPKMLSKIAMELKKKLTEFSDCLMPSD